MSIEPGRAIGGEENDVSHRVARVNYNAKEAAYYIRVGARPNGPTGTYSIVVTTR